eukprot:1414926-Heterocapsa_arctica.AAC.1
MAEAGALETIGGFIAPGEGQVETCPGKRRAPGPGFLHPRPRFQGSNQEGGSGPELHNGHP